jgi:hypothetical protein
MSTATEPSPFATLVNAVLLTDVSLWQDLFMMMQDLRAIAKKGGTALDVGGKNGVHAFFHQMGYEVLINPRTHCGLLLFPRHHFK